jgi:hypothetical protein
MAATQKKAAGKVRDAGSGQYVPKEEAKKRPKTTVTEYDRPKPKPKK